MDGAVLVVRNIILVIWFEILRHFVNGIRINEVNNIALRVSLPAFAEVLHLVYVSKVDQVVGRAELGDKVRSVFIHHQNYVIA